MTVGDIKKNKNSDAILLKSNGEANWSYKWRKYLPETVMLTVALGKYHKMKAET